MPSNIPIRLVAINARIPKGESCDGCEFISFVPYDSAGVASTREACGEPYLAMYGCVRTDGARLPACRERDGWAAFPPGSGVPELVEAALNWLNAPISGVQLDDVDARLAEAARKVKK